MMTADNISPQKQTKCCQLCRRQVQLTFHHLIPRKMHRRTYFKKHYSKQALNQGIWVCRQCHRGIHKLYDEMTLAKQLNTLEKLQRNPQIKQHVCWVAKQKETL